MALRRPPFAACAKLVEIFNWRNYARKRGQDMNSVTSIFTRDRRWFLQSICTLAILPLGGCNAAVACPLCGGRLSTVGSHIDFRFLPSVNYRVWNRSYDHVGCTGYEPGFEAAAAPKVASNGEVEITCDPEFNSQSPFCKRCCHAFSQRDQRWSRATDSPRSFVLPISQEILRFPLPSKSWIAYGVGYEQVFGGRSGKDYYSDSINFWYKTAAPPSTATDIQAYVHLHGLRLAQELASRPDGVYVRATFSGSRPKLAAG